MDTKLSRLCRAQSRHSDPRDSGFTLVELMVALFIFGLIAAAGVALLGGSVRAQESSKRHLDRMESVGRMATLLGHDFALAIPRPVKASRGAEGAFLIEQGKRLAFTRGGPPMGTERIELALTDGKLVRTTRAPAESEAGSEEILAQGVRSLAMRTRLKGEWGAGWGATNPASLPDAVELTLDSDTMPPLRLTYVVGTVR